METVNEEKNVVKCSFCGKPQDQVRKLVAGPDAYICDSCIDLCGSIIDEEIASDVVKKTMVLPKPQEIRKTLDEYVINQDLAKKTLAVAVYNHYKRINAQEEDQGVELQKSNILLLGPTGSGKTLLAQTMARILDVPFAIADATSLTEAGYVGEDVENILLKLIQAADYDIERAQTGIIYIDEIDKISRKSDNPSITRDVSGEGVQQALLKILEGTVASVPPQGGRKHPHQDFLQLDTTNVLFIVGGAFDGIETIIKRRLGKKVIGFGTDSTTNEGSLIVPVADTDDDLLGHVLPEDLLKYGLIPEFVGRIPVMATLKKLDEGALIDILTKPKNALVKQYQRMFSLDQVELEFTDEALAVIAREAIKRNTGARGLRSIIENALLDVMYELPSRKDVVKCLITEETILEGKQPLLYNRSGDLLTTGKDEAIA